jgi:Rieske 2Fe-2S family protein
MRRTRRTAAGGRAISSRSTTGTGGVLLVRGEDGALRAFANTCRHRGHELLPCGSGAQAKAIVCPYHSWTYSLWPASCAAPGTSARSRGFDFGRVAAWRAAGGGVARPGVRRHVGRGWPAAAEAPGSTRSSPRTSRSGWCRGGRHSYDAAVNWKILTENYHECYHCPTIHPELCSGSARRTAGRTTRRRAWIGGWMDAAGRHGRPCRSTARSGGVPLRGLTGEGLRTVIYVNIFPNVLLSLHPDYVMTHRLTPVAADKTRIECSWAFAPEAVARPGFDPDYAVDFWDITNRQDWGLRVGPARAVRTAGLAGAAGTRRGRDLLVRHHHRPGLPRADPVGAGSLAG